MRLPSSCSLARAMRRQSWSPDSGVPFRESHASVVTPGPARRGRKTVTLGARLGVTSVLHTWGSAITHHPHVHMIIPGGGLSEDGTRWIACRPNFFLAVRVLSRLFRRLVLQMLIAAHEAGQLQFFGAHAALADTNAFAAFLVPLRRSEWVVYSKKPFAGPEAVLAYLAR